MVVADAVTEAVGVVVVLVAGLVVKVVRELERLDWHALADTRCTEAAQTANAERIEECIV